MSNQNGSNPSAKPFMSDRVYDLLRITMEIGLPAAGVLYSAVASIWNLPFVVEIVGTIAAIGVFAGVLLRINKKRYAASVERYDGEVVVDTVNPEKDVITFHLNDDPLSIADKTNVTFKVNNTTPTE